MQALYSSGRELVVIFVAGKVQFYACSVIIFVQFKRLVVLFDASVTCFIQYLLTSCYCSLVCINVCVLTVLDIALHLAEIYNLLNGLLVVRLINIPSNNFKFQRCYRSLNVLFSVTCVT